MQLRPYQQRAVSGLRDALAAHRSVCLALQVGGGKTVIACEMMRLAIERGRRCLFIAHRVELVEQARDRLRAFGIEAGIIKAGFREHRDRAVQVACVPSLVRRKFPPADLVIIDECHHAVSQSWVRVANHYREAGAWIAGITATPARLDGRGLDEIFDAIVEPVTTRELIDGGYLIEPVVFAPPSCDLTGIRKRAGDYAIPELAVRMGKLTGSITEHWMKHGRGRRTLAFAVNVEHSQQIVEALAGVGARAVHIDGNSPAIERARANRRLRDGSLDVVSQCMLWTEGVDIPELDCLIVARPTQSLGLHRQMVGRIMRPADGKTGAIVLDHAGNHHEHGPVTEEIAWSLDARTRATRATEPITTCLECYAVLPPGAEVCPQCGAARPVREQADPPGVENDGELVRVDLTARRDVPLQEKQARYRALVQTASMRGYKLAWARIRYRDEFGVWPRFSMIEGAEYRCTAHEWETKQYGPRTVQRCARCYAEAGTRGATSRA